MQPKNVGNSIIDVLLQVGGFDVPLATALCKTFLLRMLNDR
jgi:hypothetical protein